MSGIMPRRGFKTSLNLVAALCVSSLSFVLVRH